LTALFFFLQAENTARAGALGFVVAAPLTLRVRTARSM
jgi:hypothetical protein